MDPLNIPDDFTELDSLSSGFEDDLGKDIGYVEIWRRNDLKSIWTESKIFDYIGKKWFPFGSNGGGEMLCLNTELNDGCVYYMNWVGMSDADAMDSGFTIGDLIKEVRHRLTSH